MFACMLGLLCFADPVPLPQVHGQEDEATPVSAPVSAEALGSAKEGSRRWLRWRRQARPPPSSASAASTSGSKGSAEGGDGEHIHGGDVPLDAQAGTTKKGKCHFQEQKGHLRETVVNW